MGAPLLEQTAKTNLSARRADTPAPESAAQIASPKVSVVIPAYNVASFIAETLDSVLAQTFTDYEVIVVNDGSPDTEDLERALEPYRERIRYLKQENLGAAAARNEGLRVARGLYVAFLDADDLWLPDYLSEQLKFIESGGRDLVYADAQLFGDPTVDGRTYMDSAPSTGEVTFQSLIRGDCNVITSGVLARRQLVMDVGAFDEQLRNSQDFDLWVRLSRHGARLDYQRRVLLRYRFHPDSLSGDAMNRIRRELRVLDKIETAYDLTASERAEVARAKEKLTASLALEEGKLHLERSQFKEALAAFRAANRFYRSWKLRAAILLLGFAPRLLRWLYLRRAATVGRK